MAHANHFFLRDGRKRDAKGKYQSAQNSETKGETSTYVQGMLSQVSQSRVKPLQVFRRVLQLIGYESYSCGTLNRITAMDLRGSLSVKQGQDNQMHNSCRWEGKNKMWLPCPRDQALSQKLVIDCDPASGVRQVFSASTTPHCDGYVVRWRPRRPPCLAQDQKRNPRSASTFARCQFMSNRMPSVRR
jgi:hypothetical protein